MVEFAFPIHFISQTLHDVGFPGGSVVKNLPAMQEMQVWSLVQEDPLQKGMATRSSILAWSTSMDREAWRAPWGCKKSDTTQQLSVHALHVVVWETNLLFLESLPPFWEGVRLAQLRSDVHLQSSWCLGSVLWKKGVFVSLTDSLKDAIFVGPFELQTQSFIENFLNARNEPGTALAAWLQRIPSGPVLSLVTDTFTDDNLVMKQCRSAVYSMLWKYSSRWKERVTEGAGVLAVEQG